MTTDDALAYARRGSGERKRPATGWDALTPTELQVANLVAHGLTNPQIAERLLMSRATVKTHVSHCLTKLAMATRSEIAAEATRRSDLTTAEALSPDQQHAASACPEPRSLHRVALDHTWRCGRDLTAPSEGVVVVGCGNGALLAGGAGPPRTGMEPPRGPSTCPGTGRGAPPTSTTAA